MAWKSFFLKVGAAFFGFLEFTDSATTYMANCGRAYGPPGIEGFVMGGTDAEQGAWPWMVAITMLSSRGVQDPKCTGFLIDKRHVLTAAHCFETNQTSLYSTKIGHVNLKHGDEYPISHIAIHESYKTGKHYDDITLLTLSKDVNVPHFSPICLPPPNTMKNLTSRGTTFVGWGATRRDGPMHLSLKQLSSIPVVSNEFCKGIYGRRFSDVLPQGITSRMICAGFQDESGKDSCGGDSGGPLMILEQNRWYAVGVAAFGYSCGRPDYPGVYTRVSEYLDWIKETKNLETRTNIQTNPQTQSSYPWINKQCDNAIEDQNACKDIRECDLAASILAMGGWPKVCGWVDNGVSENNPVKEWPKVCCGMPQKLGGTLMAEFLMEVTSKRGTVLSTDEEVDDNTDSEVTYPKQCVLPLEPLPDTTVKPEDGVRFGNTAFSRQEFEKDSEYLLSILHENIFAMEFKTTADSGVMFYVSARNDRRDYIALYMQDGKVIYTFECGSGAAKISSENTYNDGEWHRVVFWRHSQNGWMMIDEDPEIRGTAPGSNTRVDELKSPLFVGGLSEDTASKYGFQLQGIIASFPGCIRNVEAEGELLEPDTPSTKTGTSECSNQVEEGAFFFSDGGYIILFEKYRVGQRISMSLDIKPRNLSGVLMAVHDRRKYILLQLVDGVVEFTVDNGEGQFKTTYTPSHKHYLCDGQFHTIEVTKTSNFASVTVDNMATEPGVPVNGSSAKNTLDPLYMGGLPESSLDWTGIRTMDQFVGCIRNFRMHHERHSMSKCKVVGHVTLNTCPTI